jgi:acyl-CoA thioesterase
MPPHELFRRDRFATSNGIELLEVKSGYARMKMRATQEHTNAVGMVHGGALFTLAASAFFAACNAAGRTAVGIHMSLGCIRPSLLGVYTAEAQEIARNNRLSTCSVRVTDEAERLVAVFQGTAYIKDGLDPANEELSTGADSQARIER